MTEVDEFSAPLSDALRHLAVDVSPEQIATLAGHFALLIEANQRFNLTRITGPAQAAVRLYADSAAALAWANCNQVRAGTVLDVGSGAGFPAVPLAVLNPTWQVTALEATGKKAEFIQRCADELTVNNLQAIHAHADHWDSDATFDLVVFKAVGALEACLRWASGRVAGSGHVLVHKTAQLSSQELQAGAHAAGPSGLVRQPPFSYELPDSPSARCLTLHVFRRTSRA